MKVLLPFLRLFRRQWLMMSLGMLLTVITLAAGIGLLSLSGWFLSAAAVAGLTGVTMNYFTPAGGVRGFSIARTASRYGERLMTHEATFRILTDLRQWAWKSLLPLSERNLAGMRRADLLNRLVADIDTLDHLYLRLLTPLAAFVVMLLCLFGFIGWLDLTLALILCGGLLSAWLVLPLAFYRLGKQPGMAVLNGRRQYRIGLLAWLSGQAELALFGASKAQRAKLDTDEQRWLASQRAMAAVTGLSQAALIVFHGTILLLILWFAADGVGSHIPPGPMMAVPVFCALAVFEMMMPLAGAFQHLSSCLLAAERVSELTQQQADIVFPAESSALVSHGDIQLQGIEFAYQAQQPILQQLNLHLHAGSKVALLGKTGCGKSTLLALLTRQWQAQAGKILLDGTPVEQFTETQLRDAITVVSQRVALLAGTLRNNLQMASLSKISDERLAVVLEQVGLAHLLQGQGLNSWIGEGGRQLSGGEQRRIGVARALLRDAPILLLDEPTEGLDRRTEQEILKLLLAHAANKTLLMISHRLTGMAQMDQIHLLDGGQIVASGSHTELLANEPAYSALYKKLH